MNACVVLHNLCMEHNVPDTDDDDMTEANFGPLHDNNEDNGIRSITKELAAGRRL